MVRRRRQWPGAVFLVLFCAALCAGLLAMANAAKGEASWRSSVSQEFTVLAGGRAVRAYVIAENTGTATAPADCEVWGYGKPGQRVAIGDALTPAAAPGQKVRVVVVITGRAAAQVTGLTVGCW